MTSQLSVSMPPRTVFPRLWQTRSRYNLDEIHGNRGQAFSTTGQGYDDFNNYRWQAAKREGTIESLRRIKEYASGRQQNMETSLYGMELPTTDTLIRRAALYGKN